MNNKKNQRAPSLSDLSKVIFRSEPLTRRQKTAIASVLAACVLSTAVCAPMGGSGGQSLFETDSPAAYWPFFALSPISILFLCGRASYYIAKRSAAPHSDAWGKIRKPPQSKFSQAIQFMGIAFLGLMSGVINAYNTMQYIPFFLAIICVAFALIIPGFVNIPAMKEYYQRVKRGVKWAARKCCSRFFLSEEGDLLGDLDQSKRFYYQLSSEMRDKVDDNFSHPFISKEDKLRMLFNPVCFDQDCHETLRDKSAVTYGFALLGLVIGSFSQVFTYKLGREIGWVISDALFPSLRPVVGIFFGVMCAFLRIGIEGIACSDVLSDFSDSAHRWYVTRSLNGGVTYYLLQFGLFILALCSAAPNVENQIKTIGKEGFGGGLSTACAIISPFCLAFWAGNRVLEDFQHRGAGPSYLGCHEELATRLPIVQDPYPRLLDQHVRPDPIVGERSALLLHAF